MKKPKYKIEIKHCHYRIYDCTLIQKAGLDYADVLGLRKIKKYPRKKPVLLNPQCQTLPLPTHPDSSLIISQNGNFIYRQGENYWCCDLKSPTQQKLILLIAANNSKIDGDTALKLIKTKDESYLRKIISRINTKLRNNHIPFMVSFSNWDVSIIVTE